jgi:hypothetical protein
MKKKLLNKKKIFSKRKYLYVTDVKEDLHLLRSTPRIYVKLAIRGRSILNI